MPTKRIPYTRVALEDAVEPLADIRTTKAHLESFNSESFSIHGFESGGGIKHALAAIFDLEGFTDFSSQSDPHLTIPVFLGDFVNWLFSEIRTLSIERVDGQDVYLYNPLPFFAKFLGDGLLFLWEVDYDGIADLCENGTRNANVEIQGDIGNVISILLDICNKYKTEFSPKAARSHSRVPIRLRCGVAQGLVCALGNGADYVGPCINAAARLQKMGGLGMCVLKKGIDLSIDPAELLAMHLVPKKTKVRGVGEELVYVIQTQFEKLSSSEKRIFSDP